MLLLCEVGLAACWYHIFNIMRWGMFLENKGRTIQSSVWKLFPHPFFYCPCSPVFLYPTVFPSPFLDVSFLLPPALPSSHLALSLGFISSLSPSSTLPSFVPLSPVLSSFLQHYWSSLVFAFFFFILSFQSLLTEPFLLMFIPFFLNILSRQFRDGFDEKNGDHSLNRNWSREYSHQFFVYCSCHETRFNFKFFKKKWVVEDIICYVGFSPTG